MMPPLVTRSTASERYVQPYAALYTDHPLWGCNVALLSRLLKPLGNWLDTCCGQGWHLAQFPGHRRTGIDRSAAQLEQARLHNPDVTFIQSDITEYEAPEGQRFDVVSNFWSAYSYLNDEDAIRKLVGKLVRWTVPGGALYMELTVPELLEDFNGSEFAAETGARVSLRSPDGVSWNYRDVGGLHRMMSPSGCRLSRCGPPWRATTATSSALAGAGTSRPTRLDKIKNLHDFLRAGPVGGACLPSHRLLGS